MERYTFQVYVFYHHIYLINFNDLYSPVFYICGPGSSVGIVTDYGLEGPGSNDCLLCSMDSVRKLEFTRRFVHISLVPVKIFFFGAKFGTGANDLPSAVLTVIEPRRKCYCFVLSQTFSK